MKLFILTYGVLLSFVTHSVFNNSTKNTTSTETVYSFINTKNNPKQKSRQARIDSVLVLLNNKKNHTQVNYLCELAELYYEINTQTSLKYAQSALKLSHEIDYEKGLFISRNILIRIYQRLDNYASAIDHLNIFIQENIKNNDSIRLLHNYKILGNAYLNNGNYKETIRYLRTNLKHINYTDNYEDKYTKKGNVHNLYGLALAESDINKSDSALFHLNTAIKLFNQASPEKKSTHAAISYYLNNIGRVFYLKKDYKSSIDYYLKSENLPSNNKTSLGKVYTNYGLARNYIKQRKFHDALKRINEGLSTSKRMQFKSQVKNGYLLLSMAYNEMGDFKNAYKNLKTYDTYNSDINKENFNQSIKNLKLKNSINKIEYDKSLIEKNNEILNLNNRFLESEIRVKNIVILISFIIIGLISFFIYLLSKTIKSKEKINKELTQSKNELTKALTKLKTTQKKLIKSEKYATISSISSGLSHEINNPLNFVTGSSYLLKKSTNELNEIISVLDKNKESQIDKADIKKIRKSINLFEELFNNIEYGSNRIKNIVNSLSLLEIELSRTGNNKLNINQLIKKVTSKFKDEIDIKVENNNSNNSNAFLMGKEEDIITVIENLINNSIQSIKRKGIDNGEISITTTVTRKSNIIKIKDNGEGVSKKYLAKIYEPFFTTSNTLKGLGLSLVYAILLKYDGTIECESTDKNGSTFAITLPIIE